MSIRLLTKTGEYDYESIHALDLATFNNDLSRLLAGEEVELPTYNFELGQRVYKGNRLKLSSRSVLLIEGIHGLNPELSAGIEPEKSSLFMCRRLQQYLLTTITGCLLPTTACSGALYATSSIAE